MPWRYGYFSEENLQEAAKRKLEVLIPDPQFRQRDPDFQERKKEKIKKRYTHEDFKYNERNKSYICPNGKVLKYKGDIKLRNNEGEKYQASANDCGQCSNIEKCINIKHRKALKGVKHSRALYVVTRKYKENLSEKMKERIDNPVYRELYSQRQQIIKPVFSNMTYCKGMNRFTVRTQEKVNIQWQLFCIVHNIGKCVGAIGKNYGIIIGLT